jgi:uncharacterized membrane protein
MKHVAALAVAVAAACGETPARHVPPEAGRAAGPVRVRGTLRRRDSTLFLLACGTTVERPVTATPASQLAEALVAVTATRRDSMYVEFIADTTGGRLVARETLFASSPGEGSRCDRSRYPYDFEAVGNEPFWHVTVDGTQLVLERPERPLELAFVADAPVTRGALTTIIARRDEGRVRELKIGLLRDACRDGMSDAWYQYRAEVRFGTTALHGCARR